MAAEIPNIKPDILIIVSINGLDYSQCNVNLNNDSVTVLTSLMGICLSVVCYVRILLAVFCPSPLLYSAFMLIQSQDHGLSLQHEETGRASPHLHVFPQASLLGEHIKWSQRWLCPFLSLLVMYYQFASLKDTKERTVFKSSFEGTDG